jgi:hypothetical protein
MGARTRYSSSPGLSELSSPPRSISPPSPAKVDDLEDSSISVSYGGDGASSPKTAIASGQPQPKKRGPRKKKVNADGSSATNTDAPKERKKRTPRDPNAPKIPRKRKAAATLDVETKPASAVSKQTKLTDMGMRPSDVANGSRPSPHPNSETTQTGKNEVITTAPLTPSFNPATPQPQPPQARTSGQNYDPIRSNYDPVREMMKQNPYPSQPPVPNRASASPSIASLVDPPGHTVNSPAHSSYLNQNSRVQNLDAASIPTSPTNPRLAPSPMLTAITPAPSVQSQPAAKADQNSPALANVKKSNSAAATAPSSTVPSPKPAKVKEKDIAPPPLPGSFGMGSGPSDGTEFRAPTVVLHIPMNGETNKYVNFTKMAEERYGWDALHPRLAAQRDRLARVAAAGAALERNGSGKESGDEMSLDLSEGENSNVEMGGMSDARTGTDGGAKKPVKKRKMKEDEYDKDDGFVDDSELLWEEQAAASKDGFFVYSGPLVPEGEKPTLERYVVLTVLFMSTGTNLLQGGWQCTQTWAWTRPRRFFTWYHIWSWRWNRWRSRLSRRQD